MGRDKKRPQGYAPFLELYLRTKLEGGSLLVPAIFHGMLDAIARRECLVLVHGFNTTEGEAAAAYFGFRVRQTEIFGPGDPSIFDRRLGDAFWPGDADWWWFFDKFDFLVYPSAVRTAAKAGEQLADLLLRMPSLERVDFVAHSLGCRVTLETLKSLRARATPLVGRVCLMAAAVPAEMLEPGGRYFDLLGTLSGEGTLIEVLHSKRDTVLQYAFPPGQVLAGPGEASLRALGALGPLPSMPGFGSTLTEREIVGASHGDYWGNTKNEASVMATEAAGRFLALGEIDRDLGIRRSISAPMPGQPLRELGTFRDLGGGA